MMTRLADLLTTAWAVLFGIIATLALAAGLLIYSSGHSGFRADLAFEAASILVGGLVIAAFFQWFTSLRANEPRIADGRGLSISPSEPR